MVVMSQFSESKIRRDASGQFAEKPPAPEADGVELSTAGSSDPASLVRNAREMIEDYQTQPQGERSATALRGLRSMIAGGLDTDAAARSQSDAYLMASASRREGVGLADDRMHQVMRGITPHLDDDEVQASYDEVAHRLDRSAALLSGTSKYGDDPQDESVLRQYENRAHIAGESDLTVAASSAWSEHADYEAQRAVHTSRERANPLVEIERAPRSDAEQEYTLPRDDPGMRARRSERYAVEELAAGALYEGRSEDTAVHQIPPADLTSERIESSQARAQVRSVLVQRGMHPDEAGPRATEITRATALAEWYREGAGDSMDAADAYDHENRNTPGHEKVVLADSDDYRDGDWEPSRGYDGELEMNYETGVNFESWGDANGTAWEERSEHLLRSSLGHPPYMKGR